MSIYSRVLEDLKVNKTIREAGGYTCIPWVDFPKLCKVVPGIEKEKYHVVTASPKAGKTQITDFLFMYQPYKFVTSIESDVKLKIFYFSLEISKEQKVRQVIANKLYQEHIELSPQMMRSVYQDYILSDDILRLIERYQSYFEGFEKTVTFIDNIRNSYGIYKFIREYAEKTGKYYRKDGTIIPIEKLQHDREASIEIDHYIPNDSNEYVIVITDHISLLTPQKDEENLHKAINNFSNNFCLSMRDRFKYTIVNVQQQVASQEELKFTNKGDLIAQKLRPSVDGLADSKYTSKDVNILWGLFAPYRYKIAKYEGVDILKWGDKYRELSVILNRDGGGFVNLDTEFNGAVNSFRELKTEER